MPKLVDPNRIRAFLSDSSINVGQDASGEWLFDGMKDLATYEPIDLVCEYRGIPLSNKSNLIEYIQYPIQNQAPYKKLAYKKDDGTPIYETIGHLDHVNIVDEYFREINMPIPGGYLAYKKSFEDANKPDDSVSGSTNDTGSTETSTAGGQSDVSNAGTEATGEIQPTGV